MTRRRLPDVLAGTASERALKAAQAKRQVKRSLLTLLHVDEALLDRAELGVLNGEAGAVEKRDRLVLAVQRTAAALRE